MSIIPHSRCRAGLGTGLLQAYHSLRLYKETYRYEITDLLISKERVKTYQLHGTESFFEWPIIAQLVKKFPTFCGA
jgi:hypothetical protein